MYKEPWILRMEKCEAEKAKEKDTGREIANMDASDYTYLLAEQQHR
ncbi:MAG: hypothetical protein IJ246_06670 [Clostridia bacterium]|nr:hypothetical protein [Clostridia bacterium]